MGYGSGSGSQMGAPSINHPYIPNNNGAHGSHSPIMNITMNNVTVNHFNATKKNFLKLNKITDHNKKYVSPYGVNPLKK